VSPVFKTELFALSQLLKEGKGGEMIRVEKERTEGVSHLKFHAKTKHMCPRVHRLLKESGNSNFKARDRKQVTKSLQVSHEHLKLAFKVEQEQVTFKSLNEMSSTGSHGRERMRVN